MKTDQEKADDLLAFRSEELVRAEQSLVFLRDTNSIVRRMDCYSTQSDYGQAKACLFRGIDSLAADVAGHCRLATRGTPDDLPF